MTESCSNSGQEVEMKVCQVPNELVGFLKSTLLLVIIVSRCWCASRMVKQGGTKCTLGDEQPQVREGSAHSLIRAFSDGKQVSG